MTWLATPTLYVKRTITRPKTGKNKPFCHFFPICNRVTSSAVASTERLCRRVGAPYKRDPPPRQQLHRTSCVCGTESEGYMKAGASPQLPLFTKPILCKANLHDQSTTADLRERYSFRTRTCGFGDQLATARSVPGDVYVLGDNILIGFIQTVLGGKLPELWGS